MPRTTAVAIAAAAAAAALSNIPHLSLSLSPSHHLSVGLSSVRRRNRPAWVPANPNRFFVTVSRFSDFVGCSPRALYADRSVLTTSLTGQVAPGSRSTFVRRRTTIVTNLWRTPRVGGETVGLSSDLRQVPTLVSLICAIHS